MRKRATIALALTLAVTALLAAAFYFHARPAVIEAFDAYGTPLPRATAVAVSREFLPLVVGAALMTFASAALLPLKGSLRMTLFGVAVTVAGFALIFAVIAAFFPFFQPA